MTAGAQLIPLVPQPPSPTGGVGPEGVKKLLASFLSGKKPTTLRAYSRSLESFRDFLMVGTVGEACKKLLGNGPGEANAIALGFRAHLQELKRAPATINARLAALRSVVKLARTIGQITWSLDVAGVRSRPYRDTRGPGASGVQLLFQGLQMKSGPKGARDRAIVRLLFDLALRRGEVVGLDLKDVDLQECKISVLGKGRGEPETLTLPGPTQEALKDWIGLRGEGPGPLFRNLDRAGNGGRLTGRSVARMVARAAADVGMTRPVRPHGLRHAAITTALEAGLSIREAQRYARHSDPRTTVTYDDNREDLAGRVASAVAARLG